MKKQLRDVRSIWRFLRSGFTEFEQTAALFPSSPFLVNALVSAADLRHARRVVELGPGIGTVTREILSAMPDDGELYAIEINPEMLARMCEKVDDPRLRAIEGNAVDLERLLDEAGCARPVDAVISSLGMSLFAPEDRTTVLETVRRLLGPGAPYVQYGHVHTRIVVWHPVRGWSRFNLRKHVEPYFEDVSRKLVPLNLPPAAVFRCHNS